ncbi:tetratricopeptide repeat protein [uncultured Desulfobacter sp.]|uniref:tetratricopeptide repeat protein n=1 Tax=uncultured Desulfobacter sp. TaxID=240139 RepID=UPI002AAB9494|nr:tetratricopeptide repeat protein [uncultured Desulfobacter sp.]
MMADKSLKMLVGLLAVGLALMVVACGTPEEKKMAFYEKGKAYFEQKDFVKAQQELENALRVDPEFAPAYYMLGRTNLGLKNPKSAFQNFAMAVKLNPDHLEARLDMGKMLAGANMYDQALAQVAEVLGREPGNKEAPYLQAMVYLKQKDTARAKQVLDILGGPEGKGEQYFLLMASYLKLIGQDKAFAQTLEQGLAMHPESMPLILALAKYYGSVKDLDRVEEYLSKAIAVTPDADGIKLSLGKLYLVKKEQEKALALVTDLVSERVENDQLRVAGAVLLMKGGLKDEALSIIKEGMALHPNAYIYYAVLSEINLKSNNIKEAETMLQDYIARGENVARNDMVKAKLSLSKLKLLQKQVDEADVLIDEVLADEAGNADAHYLKGRISLARGDGTGAVAKFRSVINDYPDYIDGYLGLASAHALNKDFGMALDVLQTALKKKPDSTAILKALVRVNLARNDTAAAEGNLKKIISLEPHNLGAIAGLGDFYLAMNRYDEALAQYQQLKTQEKGEELGVLKTANALARQDKLDEAIEEMTSGYEDNSQSSVFITSLARLYMKEERYEEAIDKFKEAVTVNPNDRFAWFGLANCHELLKDYSGAVKVYEQILKDHPDSWMAANNLASHLTELSPTAENLDRAVTLAREAEKFNPGSPIMADTLGWALYKKGEVKEAEKYISSAYEQMPDTPVLAYHMGVLNHNLGNRETAAKALKTVMDNNMDFPGRDTAVEIYQKYYAN